MSSGKKSNGGKRKPPKQGSNARERARIAAQQAAQRKKRRNYAIAIAAAFVLVIGAGVGIAAWRTYGNVSAGGGEFGEPWPAQQVEPGKPATIGAADAPVTVTIYEDFLCPHCKTFNDEISETLNELQESGQVKIEYYMLTYLDAGGRTSSRQSSNAFACAMGEGFGEEYFHGLYENFGKAWNADQLIDLANQVGEPSEGFAGCVNNLEHDAWTNANMQVAQQNGVQGTPSVFINGENQGQEVGGWSADDLSNAVNQAKK